jgi:hypothetical protein
MSNGWIDDLIDQLTNDETKGDDRVELKHTQHIKEEPKIVEPELMESPKM